MSQRERILASALELMADKGAAGTGMRELADSVGVNVATLYHYFPSKDDLLAAVMEEVGYLEILAGPAPRSIAHDGDGALAALLDDAWRAMLGVEDYIRLMLGESLRGDESARRVGADLAERTQATIERWLSESVSDPDTDSAARSERARVIRLALVGAFVEYLSGVRSLSAQDRRDLSIQVAEIITR